MKFKGSKLGGKKSWGQIDFLSLDCLPKPTIYIKTESNAVAMFPPDCPANFMDTFSNVKENIIWISGIFSHFLDGQE